MELQASKEHEKKKNTEEMQSVAKRMKRRTKKIVSN